jgi:hypothetical protein
MIHNSHDCTNVIIENISENDDLIKKLKIDELCNLIKFSPSKLETLFENSVKEDEI